jgi:hypothetical protein
MGDVRKLYEVMTCDEAQKLTRGEWIESTRMFKQKKPIAFGVCMVMPDMSITTFFTNHGGALHSLNGAAHTLAARITEETI